VVAEKRRTLAGRQHAVPTLFPNCHPAATLPRTCRCLERSLSGRHIRGMAGERHGMCESNTAALCKSNGKDTIETLCRTVWQGKSRGTAWERHGMCESALRRMHTVLPLRHNAKHTGVRETDVSV
jgi:hypothetical protein